MTITIEEIKGLPGNESALSSLKEQLGLAIPFVGAGLSVSFGFPAWKAFLTKVAEEQKIFGAIEPLLDGNEYEQAAQKILELIKAPSFNMHCQRAFGDHNLKDRYEGAVSLLPHVFAGPVITTNFDNVLKRAYAQENKHFEHYVTGLDADMAVNVLRGNLRVLLKIHGDLLDPKKRILTFNDYEKHYGKIGKNGMPAKRPLPSCLEQISVGRPLVFLGCGLSEDRTMSVLRACLKMSSRADHIAIVPLPEDEAAVRRRLDQLAEFNITPIWYPWGKHEAIEVILRSLLPSDHPEAGSGVNGSSQPSASSASAGARSSFFVGRKAEIEEIGTLLRDHSFVGIYGPGGGGKTSLARKIVQAVRSDYPDGCWFVELASLVDPALLQREIGRELGLAEQNRALPTAVLKDYLLTQRALLVLDNCENLADACSELIKDLIDCPELRILATSTRNLHVPRQQSWHLEPLQLPAADARKAEVEEAEASALFLHQIRLDEPRYQPNDEDARHLARICRFLEGSPLAIELAAARYPYVALAGIASDLKKVLEFVNPSRQEMRHHTVQAVIEWSVRLLSVQAREMLFDLSVFRGGCSLEAAAKVCLEADGDERRALELLGELIDNSLVEFVRVSGESDRSERRYRLLEPIRIFANSNLPEERGNKLRWRHYDWCVNFVKGPAEQLERGQRSGPDGASPLDQLQLEHDNIRCAMDWCTDHRDVNAGMRLGVKMWRFWETRGFFSEGRQELGELIKNAGAGSDPLLLALASSALGILCYRQGEADKAKVAFDRAIELEREYGTDPMRLAICLSDKAILNNRMMNKPEEALEGFREVLRIARKQDDKRQIAVALFNIGDMELVRGEYEEAESFLEESEAIFSEEKCESDVGYPMNRLGWLRYWKKEWSRAKAQFQRTYENRERLLSKTGMFDAWEGLFWVAVGREQPDLEEAKRLFGQGATLAKEVQSKLMAAKLLEAAALLCMHQARYADALSAKLSAVHLRKAMHWQLSDDLETVQKHWVPDAKANLSPAEIDSAAAFVDTVKDVARQTDAIPHLLHMAEKIVNNY